MSGLTFEQLRIPIALILLLAAAFIFLPRGGDSHPAGMVASPEPSIIVGQPGGEVIFPETPAPEVTPVPTLGPEPTPTLTPEPTPQVAEDGIGAEVLACRSISGSSCDGQLGTLPPGAGSFTALVTFTDANAGDTINAVLSGPSGTIPGGAYTLQGGGDGYYYSTFSAGGLPAGEYRLVATRNGTEVATTDFTRGG
ncbi:MAG: hypothetical protein H0W10_02765 [Chloroflexi bacterium]|nr:hypothetical protein [Chloroflexota bacterium]